jgi:DNA repair protein RadC
MFSMLCAATAQANVSTVPAAPLPADSFVVELLENVLRPLPIEMMMAAFLQGQMVQGVHISTSHQPCFTTIPHRALVEAALKWEADAIVLIHNHPSDQARPSRADVEQTRQVASILQPIGIELLDHRIVTRSDSFSFREAGLI